MVSGRPEEVARLSHVYVQVLNHLVVWDSLNLHYDDLTSCLTRYAPATGQWGRGGGGCSLIRWLISVSVKVCLYVDALGV